MEDELKIQSQNVENRIISCFMYNHIDWTKRDKEETCRSNASYVAAYARSLPKGHWSFLGPGGEEKWCGTAAYKPDGACDRAAEEMIAIIRETGHPIFCGTSPMSRGTEERHRYITTRRVDATQFRQPTQCGRSSNGVVRKTYSASRRSSFTEHGETNCGRV